jgi:pyruvate/2-oxoglutarate dehydrogenase complex dihydrolipoamide acyltransferase (E2) component
MAISEIPLPQLAKRMTTAVFAQWLVSVGDKIEKKQPLCDVTIDKVTLEIASEIEGYLAYPLAAAGQLVPVGGIMALATTTPDEKIPREKIVAYQRFAPAPPGFVNCAITPDLGDSLVPADVMRTIIAQRMSIARTEMPHFYVTTIVDMTAAIDLRRQLKTTQRQRISYHDMIIKAAGLTLRHYPEVASLYTSQGFVRRDRMHVGFAVAVEPNGLVVPVVVDVDEKSLFAVSETVKELTRKARSKRLTPDEYGFGVFTVSSLSSYDVDQFTAIINPVNAAILAVGKIAETPVVHHREICIRPLMKITLSSDHRVIDGVVSAKFNGHLKHLLENPEMLL